MTLVFAFSCSTKWLDPTGGANGDGGSTDGGSTGGGNGDGGSTGGDSTDVIYSKDIKMDIAVPIITDVYFDSGYLKIANGIFSDTLIAIPANKDVLCQSVADKVIEAINATTVLPKGVASISVVPTQVPSGLILDGYDKKIEITLTLKAQDDYRFGLYLPYGGTKDIKLTLTPLVATDKNFFDAAIYYYLDKVKVFLKTGIDVNLKRDFAHGSDATALHAVIYYNIYYDGVYTKEGYDEMVKTLIEAGANLEAKDSNGNTPLRNSVNADPRTEKSSIVKMLLVAGANPDNTRSSDGTTPLMAASNNGLLESVKILVTAGANVNIKSNSGDTALDYARTQQIKDILIAAGGMYGADL